MCCMDPITARRDAAWVGTGVSDINGVSTGAVGCGWSCADVGLASFRDWCFTGDRVDRPRCALRFRKRVEHGERAQLDANASRGRRGEQPHTSQRQCLLDRERIGLASVFHVKPTHSRPSHRRTRSRCDLARRPAFRPRGCGWRARRDLGRWYGHNGAERPVRRVGRRIPHVSRETSSTIRVLCLDGCRSSSWERGRSRGCGRRRVWEYACAVGHIDESCKPAPGDATADALRAESTLGWGHRRPAPAHMRRRCGNERVFHVKHPRIIGRSAPLACTRPPPAHAAQWRSTIHARRRRDWTVGTAAWERDRSGSVSAGRHGQPMRSGAISSSVAQLLPPFRRAVERCTLRRSSFEWKTRAAGSSTKTWRE